MSDAVYRRSPQIVNVPSGSNVVINTQSRVGEPFLGDSVDDRITGDLSGVPSNVQPNINLPQPQVGGEILWDKLSENQKLAFNAWRVLLGGVVLSYGVVVLAPATLSALKGLSVSGAISKLYSMKNSGSSPSSVPSSPSYAGGSGFITEDQNGDPIISDIRAKALQFIGSNKKPANLANVTWERLIQRAILYGLVREGIYQAANVISRYFPSQAEQQNITNDQIDEIIKKNTVTLQAQDIQQNALQYDYTSVLASNAQIETQLKLLQLQQAQASGQITEWQKYQMQQDAKNASISAERFAKQYNLDVSQYNLSVLREQAIQQQNALSYQQSLREFDYRRSYDAQRYALDYSEYALNYSKIERDLALEERRLDQDWAYKEYLMQGQKVMYAPAEGEYIEDYGGGDWSGYPTEFYEDGGLNGYGSQQYINKVYQGLY